MNNDNYKEQRIPVRVCPEKFKSFAEPLCFRDAKARSLKPSIILQKHGREIKLHIQDKFLIRYEYKIPKRLGEKFVESTGDENVIHTDSEIVAGAMTTSKIILPLEVLTPDLEISSVNVKFTAPSFYDKKTINIFFWQYTYEEKVKVDVKTYQSGEVIAKATVWGRVRPFSERVVPAKIKGRRVNKERLSMVKEYFNSLQIDSEGYFQKGDYRDYTYPLAYLASLPSAEMVKQLDGDGGMINTLRLHFDGMYKMPIVGKKGPEVKLARQRNWQSFNKIVTEIVEGLITFCRGAAIVNPDADFLR